MSEETDEETATGYVAIATTAIQEVSQVIVYDETIPHLGIGHPELRNLTVSLEHAIHDTISRPTEVYVSNPPHVNSYRFRSTDHLYGNNAMVVAVKVVEGTSARLTTAFFTSQVTGALVWSLKND